jgi:hypothetical protein
MRPTVQELWSLQVGEGIRSGQIKPSRQNGTLRPLATEFWKNHEHQIPREFYNLYNEWQNSEF